MKAKLVKESLNENRFESSGKTDKILQMIADAGPDGVKYTDIIKFAYELSHGEGSYTNSNRGYWSGAFKTPTPDDRGFGHLIKYITKNDEGRWVVRDEELPREEMDRISNNVRYSSYPGERKVAPGGKIGNF